MAPQVTLGRQDRRDQQAQRGLMDHKVLKDPKAQLAQPDPLAKRELQAWTNHWDSVTRTEMVLQ